MGALRIDELTNLTTEDIDDFEKKKLFLVRIPKTKTKVAKSFTIQDKYYSIVKQYLNLRPTNTPHNRLFLNYRKERCTIQAVGKNKFSSMPKDIAKYLQLPNPELYTGKLSC